MKFEDDYIGGLIREATQAILAIGIVAGAFVSIALNPMGPHDFQLATMAIVIPFYFRARTESVTQKTLDKALTSVTETATSKVNGSSSG